MFQVIKYISRVGHIASIAVFSSLVIFNYLLDIKATYGDNPIYKRLLHISTAILLVTGFANIFLIKGKKKLTTSKQKRWRHFLELKFVVALTFTPLFKFPLKLFLKSESEIEQFRVKYNFYLICGFFLYSTFVKYYREEICNNFSPVFDEGEKKQLNKEVKYDKMTEENEVRK